SAVFSDAQVCAAAAAHDTGVEAAETDGIAAQLAEALHDALVRLARVCHEEMVHGHRVRVAAHIAALRFHHPRASPQPRAQRIQIAAGAVHDDEALAVFRDLPEARVGIADAAT